MRFLSVLTAFVLLVLLCAPVLAAPAVPIIDAVSADCLFPLDFDPPLLTVSAHSPDGGTLEYQWFCADTPDSSALSVIAGAVSCDYTPPVLPGTVYYCAAVCNVSGGVQSEAVYSRMICVTFLAPTTSVEILTLPDKLDYLAGEVPDLTGLRVRIQQAEYTFDSADGAGLEYSRAPLTVGRQEIILSYGEASASFFVTVHTEENHQHHFPDEWVIVQEAGCSTAGERLRTCPCGAFERDVIAPSGHVWNGGQVSGRRIKYTCTVCGTTRTSAASGKGAASSVSSGIQASPTELPAT